MGVGVDGAEPTLAVGGRLPRMLHSVLVTAGLAVLGWLLSHGVLAGLPGLEPPATASSNHSRAGDTGGQSPGLPALSPD